MNNQRNKRPYYQFSFIFTDGYDAQLNLTQKKVTSKDIVDARECIGAVNTPIQFIKVKFKGLIYR